MLREDAAVSDAADADRVISYRPSGHVAWMHFLPLAVVGMTASCILARVMAAYEATAYMLVVTPALFSVPVLGLLFLAIYAGRCRNIMVAGGLAALMTTTFYVGFWLLSYYLNVLQYGVMMQKRVEEFVGVPGLAGYFLLRCRMDGIGGDSDASMIFNLIIRGVEFGAILAAGLFMARRVAGRAYFDDYGRWASSRSFGFPTSDLPTVLRAVRQQDWILLEPIEKGPITREQRLRGYKAFRVEYLPRSFDQPVYVTVEGALLPRPVMAVLPFLSRLTGRWISQAVVSPESAHQLKKYLGALDLADAPAGQAAERAGNSSPSEAPLAYWSGDAVNRNGQTGAVKSMLSELGFAGETLVGTGTDFRANASAISLNLLAQGSLEASCLISDKSLCWPAEADPLRRMKLISRVDIALSFGFVGGEMLGALAIIAAPTLITWGPAYPALLGLAGLLSLFLGLGCLAFQLLFFAPASSAILEWYFRRRGNSMLAATPRHAQQMLIRIEDPATFHVSKMTPEDWGICVLDTQNRRLLIEGISHHYIIRGLDVTHLEAMKSSSSVAVRIDYTIDSLPFSIVLNRYGMFGALIGAISAQPLVGWIVRWLAGNPSARFARRLNAALARTEPAREQTGR